MKNKLSAFILFALLASPLFSLSQAAGNWYYNQKKSGSASNFDDGIISNNNANEAAYYRQTQQQAYYPAYSSNDTSFTIDARVMMNVKADEYVIIFATSQVGETIESCHDVINKRIDTFINTVIPLGVKKEDFYIDFISQFPIFEIEVEKKLFSKTYNEVPKGFEVRKNIHLRYKDSKIVEQMLIKASQNEIYDIVKVDYVINNSQAVYDSLRATCVRIINEKAKEYKKLGIKFDSKYQTVNDNISSTYPLDRYSTFSEFVKYTGDQTKPGSKSLPRSNVPALYYDKKSFSGYDLVINPAVIEPVVQFTCNLTVKFVLKKQ
jgi:uncharacterized protein YggE